jgi:hypothetical protein
MILSITLLIHTITNHIFNLEKKSNFVYALYLIPTIISSYVFITTNDPDGFINLLIRLIIVTLIILTQKLIIKKVKSNNIKILSKLASELLMLGAIVAFKNNIPYYEISTSFGNEITLFSIIIYIIFSGTYMIVNTIYFIYKTEDISNDMDSLFLLHTDSKDINLIIKYEGTKVGKAVGILERLIVIIVILSGYYAGIAFIFGIKSLVRFKMLENKFFSEYYLLGTLLSLSYAVIGFYLLDAYLI